MKHHMRILLAWSIPNISEITVLIAQSMRPMAFKKKEIKGPVVNDDLYVPSTLKKLLSMKKGKEKRGSERRTGRARPVQ